MLQSNPVSVQIPNQTVKVVGKGSPAMKQPIRLRGISGDVKGKVWESDAILRAGRLGTLEIVLDDSSVSRRHAELRLVERHLVGPRSGQHQRNLRQWRSTRKRGTTTPLARYRAIRQGCHDGRDGRRRGKDQRPLIRSDSRRGVNEFIVGRRRSEAGSRPQSLAAQRAINCWRCCVPGIIW